MTDNRNNHWQDNLCVILVEPVYKGNVGAISRTMNNFGFSELRIVGEIPTQSDHFVAVHSEDILNNAKVFDTFEEAVADFDRLIAISRRKGRKKPVDMLPEALGDIIRQNMGNRIGIVFGRETYGLKDEEADRCHFRCYIPAQPEFPSLNLSNAVGVILYEIYRSMTTPITETVEDSAAPLDEVEASLKFIESILEQFEYDKVGDIPKSMRIMRELVLRSNLNIWETDELRKIFNRLLIQHGNRGLRWKDFFDQ